MYTVKSVGVLSVAKIAAFTYASMALIFAPFVLIAAALGAFAGGREAAAFGMVGAVLLAIVLPVVYGLMGFVFGALSAFIYNLIAGWVGGIQLQLQAPQVFAAAAAPAPYPSA
jgi:hypothetical protein